MRRLLFPALITVLAGTACTGVIGDPTDTGSPDDPGIDAANLPEPTLHRLLARQYRNSVRDLLGDGAALAVTPPQDTEVNGFEAIGASQIAVNDDAVSKYESSARAAAAAAMGDIARIDAYVDCAPEAPGDADCHARFVERFGRLAWRRPLDQDEISRYSAIGVLAGEAYGDFHAGVERSLAAMLESPHFVYQVELGVPQATDPSVRRLTGYEMAARMSFFLLDSTPPPELLDAAEAGALDTAGGVRAAARDLLDRPEAREALRGYHDELLRLRALGELPKDQGTYPEFTPSLASAMREETLLLIDELVWDSDGDFRDFFDADHTWVNPELAAFYGVDAPSQDGFAKVTLPAEQKRGGFLGQAAFLATYAHAAGTSPTLRGKFVRERLLCQDIPAPPPGVVTVLPSDDDAKTMREKLAMHQQNPSCASCHKLMDNVGLGLENYDGVGAYRTTENGVDIDAASDLDGVAFDGAASLGAAVRDHEGVPACLVRNLYRHAAGHVETDGEEASLLAIEHAFVKSGYRLREALVEIVASDAFRGAGALEQ